MALIKTKFISGDKKNAIKEIIPISRNSSERLGLLRFNVIILNFRKCIIGTFSIDYFL